MRRGLQAAAAGAALSAGIARAEVPERAVAEAVRAHVAEALAVPPHDVEVPSVGLGRPLRCPAGADLRVDAAPGEDYRGWADLRVGAEGCEALRVRARVQVWRSVPVAAADVGAGGVVRLSSRRVLIEEVHGVSVDPSGGPFVAVAPLRAGEPVLVGRVRVAPAARSGAAVQIEAVVGGVVVRVPGKLLSDAALGERVKVLNTVHGVVVEGTLTAPDRVRTASGG